MTLLYMTYERVEIRTGAGWLAGEVREMYFVGGQMHYWVAIGGNIRVAAVPADMRHSL